LPEVFSFSESLLQPGATGNVRNSINVISEYDKVFAGKVRKTGFFQKAGFPGNSDRIFGIYYNFPSVLFFMAVHHEGSSYFIQ
jgi:hypothetical protein